MITVEYFQAASGSLIFYKRNYYGAISARDLLVPIDRESHTNAFQTGAREVRVRMSVAIESFWTC
jgi:hypothetical protein